MRFYTDGPSAPGLAEDAASPLVRRMFRGRWPDAATVDRVKAESFCENALEASVLTVPVPDTIGSGTGRKQRYGKGWNVLPIWRKALCIDRADAAPAFPTAFRFDADQGPSTEPA